MSGPEPAIRVELEREEADALMSAGSGQVHAFADHREACESAKAKLRTALSQPQPKQGGAGLCPKCGSLTCGHGLEPVTQERLQELHSPQQKRCGGSGKVSVGVNRDFDSGMLEANDEKPCSCPDCQKSGEAPDALDAIRRAASEFDELEGAAMSEWAQLLLALEAGGWELRFRGTEQKPGEGEGWPEEITIGREGPARPLMAMPPMSFRADAPAEETRRYVPESSEHSTLRNERDQWKAEAERATALAEQAANRGVAQTVQRDKAWSTLERLAGELEEEQLFHGQLKHSEKREGSRTWQDGAHYGFKRAAELVRQAASSLKGGD